jgi:hypothetical protein
MWTIIDWNCQHLPGAEFREIPFDILIDVHDFYGMELWFKAV